MKALAGLFVCAVLLQGCAVALMAGGAGAGIAGAGYLQPDERTFAAPLDKVHAATVAALGQMQITIQENTPLRLSGKAGERSVDVDLDPLTTNTTEVRVSVIEKDGVRRDGTTADEILRQTGERLATSPVSAAPAAPAAAPAPAPAPAPDPDAAVGASPAPAVIEQRPLE